ncbi:hypothetical protein L6164_020711 [Bauhinia variegata]|uniref:Uncharacterized protein n=1 Tax=Bauhinia variegata TaxID=167791 RepID=A0ACB9MXK0_BAUVA|nr:hypothetical protein L6164_020711 [Bauhinia variegata]
MWRHLWMLKTPSKLKIFLQKALYDAIPSNLAIHKRVQLREANCQTRCGIDEYTLHVLTQCPRAAGAWFSSKFFLRPELISGENFKDWWCGLCEINLMSLALSALGNLEG